MFGRASQTRLPQVAPSTKETTTEHEARQNDNRAKANMKRYADARKNATPSNLKIGDTVLVKNEKRQGKLAPFFKVEPHIVTSKNGNMITAKARDKQITRNTSCFKKAPESSSRREERSTKSDERSSNNNNQQSGGDSVLTSSKSNVTIPTAPDGEVGKGDVSVAQSQTRPTRIRREPARLKDFVRY